MKRYLILVLAAALPAQGPLAPTSNLVLDTTATQGHFAFSSIQIPAGVRVTFTGTHPVQIRCDGNAIIAGRLDVDANSTVSGPGAVTVGKGTSGAIGFGCNNSYPPGPGQHAGLYGTAIPFDLRGGSPGGDYYGYLHNYGGLCWGTQGPYPGGGGGGTLVLTAHGRIDVIGQVSANGGAFFSVGSGGSILLRGLDGVHVLAGGVVQATAESGIWNPSNVFPPGIIRLDAYETVPTVLGILDPPPTIVTLPELAETQPPLIGNTWQLRVAAPRGDGVTLAASFQPGLTTNAFGTVYIHLPTAILFAFLAMPATGHDPLVYYQLALPNDPGLVGLNLHVAGLDWLTTLPPRFTNTIATVVQ